MCDWNIVYHCSSVGVLAAEYTVTIHLFIKRHCSSNVCMCRRLSYLNLFCCMIFCAFSALTLLVGRQEGHLTCKNWVVRYWCGYLSGARCKLFAYGPADATASPSSFAPLKFRAVYLCGSGLHRLSWKKAVKTHVVVVVHDFFVHRWCSKTFQQTLLPLR